MKLANGIIWDICWDIMQCYNVNQVDPTITNVVRAIFKIVAWSCFVTNVVTLELQIFYLHQVEVKKKIQSLLNIQSKQGKKIS